MKRLATLRGLLALALLLLGHGNALAQAPATLQWERLLPNRYKILYRAFELPGQRLFHAGTVGTYDDLTVTTHTELAFAITTASGDTTQLMKPRPLPLGISERIGGFCMTSGHQVVMCGVRGPDASPFSGTCFVAAFDTTGRQLWYRPFTGLTPTSGAVKMLAVGDGYLILTALYQQIGGGNVNYAGLVKADLQGNVQWQRQISSPGWLGSGRLNDLIASPDGSYLAAGICFQPGPRMSGSGAGQQDFWLVKLRPNGDTIAHARLGQRGRYELATELKLLPDGGLVLSGVRDVGIYAYRPLLMRLDSLWRPQWELIDPLIRGASEFGGSEFVQPTTAGNVLVGGITAPVGARTFDAFLASVTATSGATASAVQWLRRRPGPGGRWAAVFTSATFTAAGDAYLKGETRDRGSTQNVLYPQNYATLFTKFANVGVPYWPDLCARPPVAYFATSVSGPAEVAVLEASTAGPRYGEVVAWAWAWGDGSTSTGPSPGPHTYAAPPPVGTAVTLTVTNSLGCTASYTEYPFGRPTAVAAARALSGRLACWPSPGAGPLHVALDGLRPQPPVPVAVLNALGQTVREARAPVQQGRLAATLDLGGLPPGVYAVRVATQEGTATRRVVRE